MTKRSVIIPDVVTEQGLKKIQSRSVPIGCWTKIKLERYLNRPRSTINRWEIILIDLLPDYCQFWPGSRKALPDYCRWVLEKINQYQLSASPWRSEKEIQQYIIRNESVLSFSKYMEQFV
jgi:hypothetical protein